MYHIFLIHSWVKGNLGCFEVLATMNNVAMNIVEHMSLWYDWASFGYIPKLVLLGLEEGFYFIFWEITILISKGTVPICNPTRNGGMFLLHPLYHKFCQQYFVFLVNLIGVKWNLTIGLIWISLMNKDVQHFLKCHSVILESSV